MPNVDTSLRLHGHFGTDYGELIDAVARRFTERLGIRFVRTPFTGERLAKATRQPIAFCRKVWCMACMPINCHLEDKNLVGGYRGFLRALRLRHGFNVEEIPLDFCGYHVRRQDRLSSHIQAERTWRRREKCVDVLLAVRLMQRCLSVNPPSGVIAVSGDADFAPAIREVARCDPPITVMVAGFADTLSNVYWSGRLLGYTWRFPPILLDDCLRDMRSKREDHPAEPSYSTIAAAV
jgi:hypothetical protein